MTARRQTAIDHETHRFAESPGIHPASRPRSVGFDAIIRHAGDVSSRHVDPAASRSGEAMKKSAAHPTLSRLRPQHLLKGLTQTRLAGCIGDRRQAIYDMEAGRYRPDTAVALRLSAVLECRVEDIFELDGPAADPSPALIGPSASDSDTRKPTSVRGKLVGFPLAGKNDFREKTCCPQTVSFLDQAAACACCSPNRPSGRGPC